MESVAVVAVATSVEGACGAARVAEGSRVAGAGRPVADPGVAGSRGRPGAVVMVPWWLGTSWDMQGSMPKVANGD